MTILAPAAPLLVQLSANAARKAEKGDPSSWAPATHARDLDEAPVFILAVFGVWV